MSKMDLKPCPFCGTDLSEYPEVMTVKPVRSDEYLLAKLEHKKIIGSDAGYNVFCVKCGCLGARGRSKEESIVKWNRRVDNDIKLIRLPCKVGDTIYHIGMFVDGIKAEVVNDFRIFEGRIALYSDSWDGRICETHQIGKVVEEIYDWNGYFLTREEAEKALKERENND